VRSPDDYFASSAPAWPAANPGDEIDGIIVERVVAQQTEYVDGKTQGDPLWWVNRKPKAMPEREARAQGLTEDDAVTQLIITLQTSARDPEIDEDDGQRRVYVKGRRMENAIKDAQKRAGVKRMADGGRLRLRFTDWDPESQNPKNPAKLYVAKYEPPATKADDYFSGQDAPPEDPWAGQDRPAFDPQHQSATRYAAGDADPVEAAVAASTSPLPTIPDSVWAEMDAATRRAVLNLQREKLASL
jgi:hypothetical protein